MLPLFGEEYPAREHLLGRIFSVSGLPADFDREVAGECLDRSHPAAVQHPQPAQRVGGLPVQRRRRSGRCAAAHRGEKQQAAPPLQQRMAQQSAEARPFRAQRADHRDAEQQIARICDRSAVGVPVDRQDAAPHVLVERGLVEAVSVARQDAVHRYDGLPRPPGIDDRQQAPIVRRRLRARIAFDLEPLEPQRERQRPGFPSGFRPEACRFRPLAQMNVSFLRGGESQQGSEQD